MKGKSSHDLLSDSTLSSLPAISAVDTDDDDERLHAVQVKMAAGINR